MATRFATALKKGTDSYATGRDAATEAMAGLGGGAPALCLVFASIDYCVAEVVQGIRSVVGPAAAVVGATSCGEFTERGVETGSVAVGLVASTDYRFEVRAARGLKDDLTQVFADLATELGDFVASPGETSVIMLVDGLAGLGEEATLTASAVFGPEARIVGGAAGDGLAFKETWVIAGDQVLTDAVAVCVAKGPSTFFAGVQHGHEPLSEPLEVTRADGSVLFEVNGRPAWDVWREATRERARDMGIDVDRLADASAEGSFLIRFELGLETGAGYKIRVPLSRGADGSLNFACTIPEGVRFRIMQSRQENQVESARTAAQRALAELGGRAVAGALVFDCVCRSIILGDAFPQAVAVMQEVVGPVPLLGFETYGEICMDPTQFSGFHNTTSVVVLIPS